MHFRTAVFISASIHTLVILPLCGKVEPHDNLIKTKPPIEVEYIVEKKAAREAPPEKRPEIMSAETPRVEMSDKPDLKSPPVGQAKRPASNDYLSYHQLIREKIRRRLKENYTDYSNQGEVYLVFTIRSDGVLLRCDIEKMASTADGRLTDIALTSLKEASPFPPFPKELSEAQLSFQLTISFKKR